MLYAQTSDITENAKKVAFVRLIQVSNLRHFYIVIEF